MTEKIRDLTILLPHRPPMILLDEVVDYGDDFAIGRVRVHSGSPFFDADLNAVPSWVGLEYMAQTIAIWAGNQQLSAGREVKMAFLLGTRSYRSNVHAFAAGATLTIRADVLYRDNEGLGSFGCVIAGMDTSGKTIEVTARLNALGPDYSEEFAKSKA